MSLNFRGGLDEVDWQRELAQVEDLGREDRRAGRKRATFEVHEIRGFYGFNRADDERIKAAYLKGWADPV